MLSRTTTTVRTGHRRCIGASNELLQHSHQSSLICFSLLGMQRHFLISLCLPCTLFQGFCGICFELLIPNLLPCPRPGLGCLSAHLPAARALTVFFILQTTVCITCKHGHHEYHTLQDCDRYHCKAFSRVTARVITAVHRQAKVSVEGAQHSRFKRRQVDSNQKVKVLLGSY
ncbi:hypothetical protein ABBQ38_001471 [Trebouxia sp. C0009 RCD-2024]